MNSMIHWLLRMIADINVTEKSFGNKQLYKELRFSVQDNEKVGLIGRNGIGKSTLFGILAGTDTDFTGDVIYKKGLVVIATRQEHHGFEKTSVLEYILSDLPEYAHLHHIINTYPETMGDDMRKIEEYTNALQRFDDLGYYTVEASIEFELDKFQIPAEKVRGPLGSLSGGQKRLVEVVKIMHAKAQLALIDEPTNHMDYVAKQQFIDWFSAARESVIVITHDRDVLHEVDKIIEIKDGRAHVFEGNYDAYLKQNSTSTVTKMHSYEVGQRTLSNLHKQIQSARAKKASTGKTPNPFIPLLNRLEKEYKELQASLEKPSIWVDRNSLEQMNDKVLASYDKYKSKNIRISGMSSKETSSSRQLMQADKLSLGYGELALFDGVSFQLLEGERIEIRGRNGAGKTTLIKAILDTAKGVSPATLKSGTLSVEPEITVGVYEQEVSPQYFDTELLHVVEQMYRAKGLSITEQKVMQLLSDYLFNPSQDGKLTVSQLSGGQKARLQLISMLADTPQVLILDEPTNHLDLPSIEILESSLHDYGGAVLYVSHDGYFREAVGGDVLGIGK